MSRFNIHCILTVSLLICCLAYWPGLDGPFVFDDSVNIKNNIRLDMKVLDIESLQSAAASSSSGPLMRPLSMVSFALNRSTTGLDPFYFKVTNLAIHLLNGIALYMLTFLLLKQYRSRFEPGLTDKHICVIGLVVTSAWLLHPLNLTTVLYVVQRMTGLASLFMILGLISFTWGRTKLITGNAGAGLILASALIFLPLAVFSKEIGLLLPCFIFLIEICFFRFQATDLNSLKFLKWFYTITVAAPMVMSVGIIAAKWDWLLQGYATRDFTLAERLMTEARVLWFYLTQIITPSNAQLGLYHDDIQVSKSLLHPATTLLAILGLLTLVLASWAFWKKKPIITFGIWFFLIGHTLESTILPLEIAHEHRNYLPMFGIVFILFFYLLHPLLYPSNLRTRWVGATLLIGLFAFNTHVRAQQWANPYDLFQAEVEHHPSSAIANGEMAAIYSNLFVPDPRIMENYYQTASQYFHKAAELNPNDTKPFFGHIWLDASRNKPTSKALIDQLKYRLEHAPYAAISSDKMTVLYECIKDSRCQLPATEYADLAQAALNNPTLSGSNKIKVLKAYSRYLVSHKQYPEAIQVMEQLIALAPDQIQYRIALINFLAATEHDTEAQQEREKLQSLNLNSESLRINNHSTQPAARGLVQ